MCAISGLLRVKRPHVNASRNIRPRLVVLLLRTHFCRPNELAVSSSPLCIARLPPHQDQGSCATAPPAAQVDRESCFSTRGLFPSTQEMRRSAGPAGMRSSLLCCDNSTASQDEPRLSLRLLALGCFQLVCASPPPPPPSRASRSWPLGKRHCHVCLLAGVMTCHSRVDQLPRRVQELVCGRCFDKLDAAVTISSRARRGNGQPSHAPDPISPAIFVRELFSVRGDHGWFPV